MKYLIIGNGVAGTEAAIQIRKLNSNAEITIISESEYLFYNRPRLIEFLAGKIKLDELIRYKEEFYSENKIEQILGLKIKNIDTQEKYIESIDGEKFDYDKLLIATGARAFLPNIKGNHKDGVFVFRGIKDSKNIKEFCCLSSEVIVAGGGLLGLEAANSLKELGASVTVVEYFDSLLPRQLDKRGGEILKEKLEAKGIKFILGDYIEEILGNEKVEGIKLNSGKNLKANSLVFSVGIRPRLELAKKAGIKCDKGIIINEYMETNISDIYAAGDVSEFEGASYGLWLPAREQGINAAKNMAGIETKYEKSKFEARLKVADINVFSIGDIKKEADETKIYDKDGIYKKFNIKDNKLISAIIIGDNKAALLAGKIYSGNESIEKIKEVFFN